jgi:hypothetical protein
MKINDINNIFSSTSIASSMRALRLRSTCYLRFGHMMEQGFPQI